jgi:RNA polymerase sigma-70 factor (ECF subfamily)
VQTDAQLLAAARTDPHAFRQLYERYAERIHRFHLGQTRRPDAALDLTAETFAQAWLSRSRFEDRAGGSAGPWLYAIARHVLVDSVRRRRLERRACERLGLLSELDRPEKVAEPTDVWLDGLDEAWEELSPDMREAVRLRVLQELPYDEVADATGTSAGAARVRVHRGLTALRHRLLPVKEPTR